MTKVQLCRYDLVQIGLNWFGVPITENGRPMEEGKVPINPFIAALERHNLYTYVALFDSLFLGSNRYNMEIKANSVAYEIDRENRTMVITGILESSSVDDYIFYILRGTVIGVKMFSLDWLTGYEHD